MAVTNWGAPLARVGLLLCIASTALIAGSNSSDRGEPRPAISRAREAMIRTLGSPNPNPALGDEAQTFDRLVGTWDADFSFHRDDGTVRHKKGELHFGWVMDGTAVQDLWIGYPSEGQAQRSIGTTFRFFDTKEKQWRIVFINPRFNYLVIAQGRREGDRIVFHGVDTDGLPLRWTFSEITANSFHWQGEKSHDGGKTWTIEEDHRMKRRHA